MSRKFLKILSPMQFIFLCVFLDIFCFGDFCEACRNYLLMYFSEVSKRKDDLQGSNILCLSLSTLLFV